MSKIYKSLSDIKKMYLIKKSGYFDEEYYKLEYPEVKGNLLKHYYYCGYKMGYNPSSKFNNDYYLKANPDVSSAMINPLVHYLVCGKNEGRKIVLDKGLSIGELYTNFYGKRYNYDVYRTSTEAKRVNLFVDGILQYSFEELIAFLRVILKKCKAMKADLRVFYTKVDWNLLNKLLVECEKEIEIPNISYVLISDNYLLEFGSNEIIFCVDFAVMYALTNTNYLDCPLYYLVSNEVQLDYEEEVMLSFLVKNGRVKCLSLGEIEFKVYNLQVAEEFKINLKEIECLGFDLGDLFILGILLVNDYFGKSFWKGELYYKARNGQKKFYLDNDTIVRPLRDKCPDWYLRFSDEKHKERRDKVIDVYVEETDWVIDYFNILDEGISSKLDEVGDKVNQDMSFGKLFDGVFIVGEGNV